MMGDKVGRGCRGYHGATRRNEGCRQGAMMVVVVVMVVVVRQYLWLGERWYLHQSLVLVCLERAQRGLGQHGLCGQHGLQLLQRQGLSRCNGKL